MQMLWNQILDLLFPPCCAGCGKPGAWFCPRCVGRCHPLAPEENRRLHAQLGATSLCSSAGVFTFAPPMREGIHALKYRRYSVLAQPLGKLVSSFYHDRIPPVDAVVAVPLWKERQRERGFNQAELLARVLVADLQLPLLDRQLYRTRATDQQAQLRRSERRNNVKDAFAWRGKPPPPRILLFDDVMTSGATMDACASALYAAGAKEVHGLALARGSA